MIKKGDRVIMNDKYYVSEKNKGKEFIVTTEPTEVCGTLSVWLEGIRGCYAIDGLTKVNWNLAEKSNIKDDVLNIVFVSFVNFISYKITNPSG